MCGHEECAKADAMLRRHGVNLEGTCWWCGPDQPYPCPTYVAAEQVLAACDERNADR